MKWQKRGLIYAPRGDAWWARSYATLPTAEVIDANVIRVYFASLDDDQFGRTGYVDVDAKDPSRIVYESREPVLDLGDIGTFDDSGVNPSCVINVGGKKYLYYIGWQRAVRVPYLLFAGLAIEEADGTFSRHSSVPVLDRTPDEPYLRSATTILVEEGTFRAWYVSGFDWIELQGVKYPTYVIRYATSSDGIDWKAHKETSIELSGPDEFGFGRPWVVRDESGYKMWYSIRSRSAPYKIGYAESEDGVSWSRMDGEAGIERAETGWDSEMICYPCVVDAAGKRYMFYNGNRHGSTGFGYAILEND